MKKIISIVLSVLMLSAMVIPAMAEGEAVINKLDYALSVENFGSDTYSSASEVAPVVINENDNNVLQVSGIGAEKANGVYVGSGNSDNAVADYAYEAGFKIKLTNPGVSGETLHVQLLGSALSYPVISNIKFISYGGHDNDYRLLRSSTLIADRGDGLITGEWNDIRFLVTESSTTNSLTYYVYVNGVLCHERTQNVTDLNTEGKAAARNPYRWLFYCEGGEISSSICIDDVYIASYDAVTTFTQETVNVSVAVGEDAVIPSTVNVTVDGVQEDVEVEWADVDTTTAGVKTVTGVVKGYTMSDASDVTVTATVTVEAPQEPKYPYELAIDGATLTVTKAGTLTPEAKVYGAVYENGLLTDVQLLGTLSGSTAWTDGKANLPLEEGKTYRAFIISDQLVPYAVSTELN